MSQAGRTGKQPTTSQNTEGQHDLMHLIQQHDDAGHPERLTSQLAARAGLGHASIIEAKASAAASMRASEAQQSSESTGTPTEGRIVYLFRLVKAMISYLTENKIEAMIYLWVLILISSSVKAFFRRS